MSTPVAAAGPLSHLHVLDLTQRLGYASKLYADLGADVVLVEPPEGVAARHHRPFLDNVAGPERSLHFHYLSAGKRSAVVDFACAEDRDFFTRMVERADIVLDDRRQLFWEGIGLGYAELSWKNPQLIWCTVTPFGQTGPRAGDAADDFTLMAAGGMAWLTGYEASGPLVAAGELSIYSAAQYVAAMSLVAATGRAAVGGGQFIDVSIQEVVALGTETAPQFYDLKGVTRRRLGEKERQAGIGVYPCRDGHVLLYAADSGLGIGWSNLVNWLVEEHGPEAKTLAAPEWFDNAFKSRPENMLTFRSLFTRFAETRGKQRLFEEGQRRRIAIAPINDSADAFADPHLAERGFFVAGGEVEGRPTTVPGAPYRLSRTPWAIRGAAPRLGEHTEALRREFHPQKVPA